MVVILKINIFRENISAADLLLPRSCSANTVTNNTGALTICTNSSNIRQGKDYYILIELLKNYVHQFNMFLKATKYVFPINSLILLKKGLFITD